MYTGMSVIHVSTPDIKRHQGRSILSAWWRDGKSLGEVSLHYVIVQANISYLHKYQGMYA